MKGIKYLKTYTDRHGIVRHYFRRNGVHTTLPAPGTAGFDDAYQAALSKVHVDLGHPTPPYYRKKTRIGLERRRAEPKPIGGVYLLMLGSRIVYVGRSENMPSRVTAHRCNGRPFDRAYYINVPSQKDRAELEALLIASLRPEQNRTGVEPETSKQEAVYTPSPGIQNAPQVIEDAHAKIESGRPGRTTAIQSNHSG